MRFVAYVVGGAAVICVGVLAYYFLVAANRLAHGQTAIMLLGSLMAIVAALVISGLPIARDVLQRAYPEVAAFTRVIWFGCLFAGVAAIWVAVMLSPVGGASTKQERVCDCCECWYETVAVAPPDADTVNAQHRSLGILGLLALFGAAVFPGISAMAYAEAYRLATGEASPAPAVPLRAAQFEPVPVSEISHEELFRGWITHSVVLDPAAKTSSDVLFDHFLHVCLANGCTTATAPNQTVWGNMMRAWMSGKQVTKYRNDGIWYRGVRLVNQTASHEPPQPTGEQ